MTVYELFNPLNARLFEMKDGNSLPPNEYGVLMSIIASNVDRFPAIDVIPIANYYLSRAKDRIETINAKYPIEVKSIKRPVPIEIINGKNKPGIPEEIFLLEELEYYFDQLNLIINERKKASIIDSTQKETIKLPDNFSVKLLSNYITAKLSVPQAALLLYYLRETGIIPNYNNSELGRVAEFMLGASKKRITTELTDIYSVKTSKQEMTELRNRMKELLASIETDFKEL